jgi:hypothetical protein
MSLRTPLLRTLVPLLLLASCQTDPRELKFGIAQGSSSPPAAGTGGGGAGSPPIADAGEPALPTGGTTSLAGANSGGEPSSAGGGDDAGGEGPSPAGSSSGGAAGAGVGGAPAGVGGGGTGGGGEGGSGGGSTDAGPCGDLDQNGVQDCDETVVLNSRFDTNAASWLAEPSVAQVWRAEDARGASSSGALGLTFTTAGNGDSSWGLAAASQCHAAWSDETFVAGARVMVPQGQAGGRAQLELAFFDNDGCQGTVLTSQTAVFSSQPGAWQALHQTVQTPPGTRSVLLRLAAAKPSTQASLEVRFDDVLFRKN